MTVTKIEPTCNVDDWDKLPIQEKFRLKLIWSTDPVAFWMDTAGGNFKLWDSQVAILKPFFAINEDGTRKINELVFQSGMRGGKTTISALITLTELFRLLIIDNPQEKYGLANNSEIMFINVAPNEQQALDTVFRRATEIIMNSPFLSAQNPYATYNTIRFPKSLTIKALGSNTGGNVGRTVKCFVADEVSSFLDNSSRRGPREIYFKMSKSTGSFKKWNENIRVAISSPAYQGDFITTLIKEAREQNSPRVLAIELPTWDLNPNMSYETLKEERDRDPISFDRDYGGKPHAEMEGFFNPSLLKIVKENSMKNFNLFVGECDPNSRDEFYPILDYTKLDIKHFPLAGDWFLGTDPAVKNDAFGLSIGYQDINGNIVVVGSTVFKAAKGEEINTDEIRKILKELLEAFPIRFYLFDVYLHSELQSMVRGYSVQTIQNTLDVNDWILLRNDLYDDKAKVPYSEYLFKEFNELLLIKNKKIDHPRSGSKDMADSACQVVSYIRREEEEARLHNVAVPTYFMGRF